MVTETVGGDPRQNKDLVDVFEEMLYERAVRGFRPVLYVSSFTDLECNMVMLLDESSPVIPMDEQKKWKTIVDTQVLMN